MIGFKESLQRVFTPEKFGREQAKALVDRYETIKPDLLKLGVELADSGSRGSGDTWNITYTLICAKEKAGAVKALLDQANIQDLADPDEFQNRMKDAGLLTAYMSGTTESSLNYLEMQLNTRQFVIYMGSHMSLEDSKRLRVLPGEVT